MLSKAFVRIFVCALKFDIKYEVVKVQFVLLHIYIRYTLLLPP
jgi:hypothetical protein